MWYHNRDPEQFVGYELRVLCYSVPFLHYGPFCDSKEEAEAFREYSTPSMAASDHVREQGPRAEGVVVMPRQMLMAVAQAKLLGVRHAVQLQSLVRQIHKVDSFSTLGFGSHVLPHCHYSTLTFVSQVIKNILLSPWVCHGLEENLERVTWRKSRI
jgi:hypothetical protein